MCVSCSVSQKALYKRSTSMTVIFRLDFWPFRLLLSGNRAILSGVAIYKICIDIVTELWAISVIREVKQKVIIVSPILVASPMMNVVLCYCCVWQKDAYSVMREVSGWFSCGKHLGLLRCHLLLLCFTKGLITEVSEWLSGWSNLLERVFTLLSTIKTKLWNCESCHLM